MFSAMSIAATLSGCATMERPDPLEPVNRKVFAFNEGVDKVVLKPVATAYRAVLPQPVRTGVTNVFANFGDPWSALNLALQGRFKEGLIDLGRFATNTTVGVLGLFDVASNWGMPRNKQDFGQTLGRWGVGPGAYLVLPLLGPSSVRDTAALPLDRYGALPTYVDNVPVRNSLIVLGVVNLRARALQATSMVDDMALDKYSFYRDAYLQRRRNLINDGKPDVEASSSSSSEDDMAPPAPVSAPIPVPVPAASAPSSAAASAASTAP